MRCEVSVGKWNTGFFCPASEDRTSVYCCGDQHHKYCCTSTQEVGVSHLESVTLLIGILVGVATAVILVMIIICVSRPWANYRRQSKQSDKQGNSYLEQFRPTV